MLVFIAKYKLMTFEVHQIALLLDVHETTVRHHIRQGHLPAQRIGKSYRIEPDGLKTFFGYWAPGASWQQYLRSRENDPDAGETARALLQMEP